MRTPVLLASILAAVTASGAAAQQSPQAPPARGATSYSPVTGTEKLSDVRARMEGQKAEIASRQQKLLAERYDLADRPASGVKMARSKAVQSGVRVKLPQGTTWAQLAAMTP